MIRPATFVAVLLATALLSGVGIYVGTWLADVRACRMLDRPGAYLAYCETPAFGSYEHEAYALDTEPGAVRAMQAADVLFLGNSRLQFGFSTEATDGFFRAIGATYHLLGFGYGESSVFPHDLIMQYRPRPRAVVINADPFFQHAFSPAVAEMRLKGRWAWLDAELKKAFGRLQPWLCSVGLPCTGADPSTYRDIRTGQWIWRGLTLPLDIRGVPIPADKVHGWSEATLPTWVREAEAFLAALALPRSCVILVGVPTPQVDSAGMAAAIGRRLGATVIDVAVGGLESSDGSHLTADSADRWSAAFFAAAGPAIRACVAA